MLRFLAKLNGRCETLNKNNFLTCLIHVVAISKQSFEILKQLRKTASTVGDYSWANALVRWQKTRWLFRWSLYWDTRNFLRCSFQTNPSSLPSLRIQHEKGALVSPSTRRSRRITTALVHRCLLYVYKRHRIAPDRLNCLSLVYVFIRSYLNNWPPDRATA